VLAEETGVVNVADPLGGSWYVEALTDKIEAEALAILDRIEELGGGSRRQHTIGPITSGLLLGIEEGWFTGQIADSAFRYQTQLEQGDKKIVGVNVHTETVTKPLKILRVSHEVEVEQCATLKARRAARDNAAVQVALQEMIKVAQTDGNMIEPMLAATRAEAPLGEMCNALRAEWGEYVEPARF
jgi:methylmalonyl-CoA mutase N-terminal domain/subunit